jgi:hypothetical protein
MAKVYRPIGIQEDAHRAILLEGYKRAILYWSRRCFAAGTLVATEYGDMPIEDVRTGMRVWANNGTKPVLKVVEDTHVFGLDSRPKPMVQCVLNGQPIYATYDHEFRVGSHWVPLYILTWRALAPRYRTLLELLCKQSGTPLDHTEIRSRLNQLDASGDRRLWVLTNGAEREDNQTTPDSSADLAQKSAEQTTGESHRQQPTEQSRRQSGVGNAGREHGPHDDTGATNTQLRRKKWNAQANGSTGVGDNDVPSATPGNVQTSNVKGISQEISDKVGEYSPYFERPHLEIQSATVTWGQVTYDLSVEDVHNYTANGINCHNTGKTMWSVQQLMFSCMLHQGPHHIVFKEYQQAETVAWNQYMHLIPKGLIMETNKSTLTVTFNYFNGTVKLPDPIGVVHLKADLDKPPASIRLLGSDRYDSHRGGESYGMIFDEYQDQDHDAWDFVYSKFFYTTGGWAAFMGTAKPEDKWIEMLENAETSYRETKDLSPKGYDDWYYSKATWRNNPLILPEIVEADRRQAEREGKLAVFLQETELIPFTQQGAVYPMFHKQIHVIKPSEVPEQGTDYIALDFGFAEGHPMAMCFIRITRDDVWYQWDEIHGSGIQLDDAIAEMWSKLGDRKLTAIIADSARPDLIEYMQSKGLPVIPAPKKQNSVASGIQLFAKRLRPKIQVIGEPKPNYFVASNCRATIYDFVHYRYKEIKENRLAQENPEKKYDDTMDALRYLDLYFKYGHQDLNKAIPQSISFNAYGLM